MLTYVGGRGASSGSAPKSTQLPEIGMSWTIQDLAAGEASLSHQLDEKVAPPSCYNVSHDWGWAGRWGWQLVTWCPWWPLPAGRSTCPGYPRLCEWTAI